MRLDRRHQLARLVGARDEAEPAPRRDVVLGQFQNAIGERIALAEVIEEPPVERGLGERRLDFGDAAHWKRFPHACTRSGSIRTSGFLSCVSVIARYCEYL